MTEKLVYLLHVFYHHYFQHILKCDWTFYLKIGTMHKKGVQNVTCFFITIVFNIFSSVIEHFTWKLEKCTKRGTKKVNRLIFTFGISSSSPAKNEGLVRIMLQKGWEWKKTLSLKKALDIILYMFKECSFMYLW